MTKKYSASLIAWALVWSSVAPAAPAFAAAQFQAKPGAPLLATRVLPAAVSAAPTAAIPTLISGVSVIVTPVAPLSASLSARPAAASPAAAAVVAAAPVTTAALAQPQTHAAAPTLLGRVVNAVATHLPWTRVFDASKGASSSASVSAGLGVAGIRPLPKPVLPQGFDLDDAPTTPNSAQVGGIEINAWDTPGAKSSGGIFDSAPRVIQADPTSEADVERALREMVDADAAKYGVSSAELKTIHVRRVAGVGDQADTIYAFFRQQRKSDNPDGSSQNVQVNGSYLSFTVKVVKNQPTVMAAMSRLYPTLSVKTSAAMSDAELKAHAEQKLPQGYNIELLFIERKILYHNGAWKTVNLYDLEGLPQAVGVQVAVDVATGEVFTWDARIGMHAAPAADPQAPAAAVTGRATARAEADDHRPDGKPVLVELPLPELTATVDGRPIMTDTDGRWSASASGPTKFKAKLEGKWAKVYDKNNHPVTIDAAVNPGDNVVVANPTASDLLTVDQVNMYIWITRIHDWWSARLNADKRIDNQIPVNVNIDQDCNAYYTPGRPSLNFFKESSRCSDTGKAGIGAHEYGHHVDNMIGGITNGGMSEGWGDIGSMFLLGTPIIGEGFLKNRNPSWIRHGDNTYQYSDNDEVHDQGQAWMGFAWKLRKMLIASLGEAAGAAKAEALIIPTLFAKAGDIPSQMAQVLLNAMDKDGKIQHEKEIRAAAKAHGIDLPQNPGVIQTLWAGLTSAFKGVSVEEPAKQKPVVVLGVDYVAQDQTAGNSRRLVVKAGRRAADDFRRRVESAMQYRPEEHAVLEYTITESRGWLATEFSIEISGAPKSVSYMVEQINRLAR